MKQTTRLTNLTWLEGKMARVIADGFFVGDFLVKDGAIDLPCPVTKGWVGLPYEARLRTLTRDDGLGGVLSRVAKRSYDRLALETAGLGGSVGFVYGVNGKLTDPQAVRPFPTRRAHDALGAAVLLRDQFEDYEMASEFETTPMIEITNEPGFPQQIRTIEYHVQANGG